MQLAHGLLGQPTFEHGQLVDKVHAFVAHPGSTWQVETKQGVQAIGKKMHRRASCFATTLPGTPQLLVSKAQALHGQKALA